MAARFNAAAATKESRESDECFSEKNKLKRNEINKQKINYIKKRKR